MSYLLVDFEPFPDDVALKFDKSSTNNVKTNNTRNRYNI